MKFLCVLLLIGVCTAHPTWEEWKQTHSKQYAVGEEAKRQYIWNNNLKYVLQHNLEGHTYEVGMNKFADLDHEEWQSLYLSKLIKNPASKPDKIHTATPGKVYDSSYNWVDYGYVTPVKDQGQCGSCYSFSSTGALEGQHFKATGVLPSLSEQNIMDCSTSYGNAGCNGGWMDQAFEYIRDNGGIDTEASYPYKATSSSSCKYNRAYSGATVSGIVDVQSGSEAALLDAVSTVGPVAVAIDASHRSFQLYTSGVYYERKCSNRMLDHAVLAVGYGTTSGTDYWIVKNSWGTGWGQDGYIWMSRNVNKNCGIAEAASYPLV